MNVTLFVDAADEAGARQYVEAGLERGIPENDDCLGWTFEAVEAGEP